VFVGRRKTAVNSDAAVSSYPITQYRNPNDRNTMETEALKTVASGDLSQIWCTL
jgi:hypothetical protein